MSSSPMLRRLSSSTSTSGDPKEDLINAYEAEEERIINVLSRKLEQLREEKITLENALEAESESHVNRLNRELSLLRARQRAADEIELPSTGQMAVPGFDPRFPTPEAMLEAMRKENESLRNRLVDTERDYVRIARLNEVYREELIDHRRRLGLSVDNLVGLPGSAADPYSQPLHRRSASGSPNTSVYPLPSSYAPRSPLSGVPIPRPPSQLHRPNASQPAAGDSSSSTPLTNSPPASPSPFPFSPVTNTQPTSYLSNATQLTTPSSAAASLHSTPPPPFPAQASNTLSYPSVPPPSLSSSLGSPTFPYPHSPVDNRGSRSSRPCARVAEVGNLRDISRSRSRRGSLADSRSQPGSPNLNGVLTQSPSGSLPPSHSPNAGNDPLLRTSSSHRVAETGTLSRRRSLANGGSESES
ncbi:hypothetical protein JB92DRAFT_2746006 [Gautieria morchelliformis]|nr:hypothetical protein JB92DRAFT_2746006 [Gautieria morchelliformis]